MKSKNFGVWTTYLAIDSVLGGMLVLGEVVKKVNIKQQRAGTSLVAQW